MHPIGGEAVSIIGGALIVLGFIAYFLFKSYTGIEVSNLSLALDVSQSAIVTASFNRKKWALGAWERVPGSFNVRPFRLLNPVVAATPSNETTSAAAPALTVTVTALAPGYDTVRISGFPAGDTNVASADLATSVVSE
jgi:hypothetical protein